VKVTSWLPAADGPDTDPTPNRPFIAYTQAGSRLDVTDSDFGYLGTDTSFGYGVSWGADTAGQALRSVFHNNLFGAYTSRAVGVTFQNNLFRNNARYGLDPHTNSRDLVITNNEAYGNNTHGIIFSQGVTNSVIADNHTHDNGANGIMMDETSDNNVIQNNITEHNAGAGIVLQGSSGNHVIGNVVANNPIGIRVNANRLGVAVNNHVGGNQLSTNHTGIKVYNNTRNTTLGDNTIRDTQDTALALMDPTISQSDSVINAYKAAVISKGTSTLHALSAQQVARGIIVGSGATAAIESGNIAATEVGIAMHDNATLALSGSLTTIDGARKGVIVNG
ncbi:MAG: right-handed parallel beta-helix repeat-containing protein, partial [Candidatus Dormibacteria bacterium]